MDSVYKTKLERPFSAFDILKDFFFFKSICLLKFVCGGHTRSMS